MMKLNQENLKQIKSAALTVPEYDRKALRPAIVHVGLGHFHRAHQALFLDRLVSGGLCKAGVFEVNLVPDPYPLAKIAADQDRLYTLLARASDGSEEARVIGVILGYLNATDDKPAAIARIALPETAVVTMTVTEKGYCYNFATGALDWNFPTIAHDVAYPDDPESAVGFLCAALNKRAKDNALPLTVMSCDNFPQNGKTLKACVRLFCEKAYPDIIPWIEKNVAFPCSMVDRITPNTAPETLQYLKDKYGIDDSWAVACEDFIQWVLEDDFKLPPLADFDPRLYAKVGVQIVSDVEPYELMKMRLLNASHSALAYSSYLMGYREVDKAASDPLLRVFIRERFMEEITPTLKPVPGIDVTAYKDKLISRFTNRHIADQVLRLAEDGSKKIPTYILGALTDAVKRGLPYQAIMFALACWARFLNGKDEQGSTIPIKDPDGGEVIAAAPQAREKPAEFLRVSGIHGLDAAQNAELAETFRVFLEAVYRKGVRAALEDFLKR